MRRFTLALALLALGTRAPAGCELPGEALPADHHWYAEARDLFDDIAADPELPSLDGARCRRELPRFRIVHASEGAFLRLSEGWGLCPVVADLGTCRPECVGYCAAGFFDMTSERGRRQATPTAIIAPGATADGFRHVVRHEATHAAVLCATGAFGGHPAPWFGPGAHEWRPMLPAECDLPNATGCGAQAPTCDAAPPLECAR